MTLSNFLEMTDIKETVTPKIYWTEANFLLEISKDTNTGKREKALKIAKSLGYYEYIDESDLYKGCDNHRSTCLYSTKGSYCSRALNYKPYPKNKTNSLGWFSNIMSLITTPAPINPNLRNKKSKPKDLNDPDYIEALRELNKEFPCVGDESI